jgi:gamma-glutamylcysteine synthetase
LHAPIEFISVILKISNRDLKSVIYVQLSTDVKFNLIQVNLDFSSEQDMIKKLRVGLALQPVGIRIIFWGH